MNDTSELIKRLESEYDIDRGFLGRLRQGAFDKEGLDRLLSVLKSIDFGHAKSIDRRLVSLLWLIPTLMEWQRERVAEKGGDITQLQRWASTRVQSALNKVLGMP